MSLWPAICMHKHISVTCILLFKYACTSALPMTTSIQPNEKGTTDGLLQSANMYRG